MERRRYDVAERLLKSSNGPLFAKWPASTLYGHDAAQRNIALHERRTRPDEAAGFRSMLR